MRITPRGGGRRIARIVLLSLLAFAGVATSNALAAPYSTTVLTETPAPLAYFELDEPVGASVADNAVVAGGDGAYYNGVRLRRDAAVACEQRTPWGGFVSAACEAAGRSDAAGWSAYFDGVDDSIDFHEDDHLADELWSVEMWVKPTRSGVTQGLFQNHAVLWTDEDDHFNCKQFGDDSSDAAQVARSNAPFSVGSTYHVACVRDNDEVRLYVNGVLQADIGVPVVSATNNADLQGKIGLINSPYALWQGYIDNVASYPGVIDVAAHYALGIAGATGEVLSLTPESGSAFSGDSTKGASTRLKFTCTVPCTYDVDGPTTANVLVGGPVMSADVPLPLGDGDGTYTIHVTGGGYTATSTYVLGDFSTVILNDAPTAWWRFDEADGIGIAADSAAGGLYPGAYQNPSSNGGIGISGDASAARQFKDGDGGYVGINDVEAKTEAYTIELWFKTAAGDLDDMALFDHGAHGGGPALYLVGSDVRYRAVDGDIVSAPFVRGAWTHVAATWDGVTARLYVEGQSAGTPASVSLSPSGTPALYLGFANVGLEKPAFRGLLDEVSYYGTTLSADRVLNHYLADPPAPTRAVIEPAVKGPAGTPISVDSNTKPAAAAPARAKVAKKVRAKAKARAKARAKAKAKALKKAKARAKAKARKARAVRSHRTA